MSNSLGASAYAAAGYSSDGCSFAAPCEGANNRSESRATPDFLGCVLAARAALLGVLIGLNVVGISRRDDTIELKYEQGLSGELASAMHIQDMAFDAVARWNGCGAVHGQRRVERGMEGLSLRGSF